MNVAPEFRGRVLSTLFLQRGMVPLGTMIAGVATTVVGPRVAMGAMAASMLVLAVLAVPYVLSTLRGMRTERASQPEAKAGSSTRPPRTDAVVSSSRRG